MSLADAVCFTERLMADESLRHRAEAAIEGLEGTPATDALVSLASTEGLEFGAADILRARALALGESELSEDELSRVAGGGWEEDLAAAEAKLDAVGREGEEANSDLGSQLVREYRKIPRISGVSQTLFDRGLTSLLNIG